MAINIIGKGGTFKPLTNTYQIEDKSSYATHQGKILHSIDLSFQKIDVNEYIKWCRRNLGERSRMWDFWMAGNMLYVEVWGEKEKFTYEMWKN